MPNSFFCSLYGLWSSLASHQSRQPLVGLPFSLLWLYQHKRSYSTKIRISLLAEQQKNSLFTSTFALVHSTRLTSFSSGILGSCSNPKLFATPTRSRSLRRKIYEASCLEYARTNETKAFAAWRQFQSSISGSWQKTYTDLVMYGTIT